MTAKAGNRVVICTVTGGPPNWPYVNGIFGLRTPGQKMFKVVKGKQGVDEGHNQLIRWFLDSTDYEWMLHLDSDAVVHPDTLLRLLSWNEPFVSAFAFQRIPPFVPVVYKGRVGETNCFVRPVIEVVEWLTDHADIVQFMGHPVVLEPRPDDALYEVDRGGAHCLLTHRSVLEAIPEPWYERVGEGGGGSDFDFYGKAKQAGFTTWLDRSTLAGHVTSDLVIGAIDFAMWSHACVWTQSGCLSGLAVDLPKMKIYSD